MRSVVRVRKLIRPPWAEQACIPLTPHNKLRDYALSPSHPKGRHKAELFQRRLGIVQEDWRYLHDQILGRLPSCPVARLGIDIFPDRGHPDLSAGVVYDVHIPIEGREGRSCTILTAWRVDTRLTPSLTTTRVLD